MSDNAIAPQAKYVPYELDWAQADAAPGRELWSLRRLESDGRWWRAGWDSEADLKRDVRPVVKAAWPGGKPRCSIEKCFIRDRPMPGERLGHRRIRYMVRIDAPAA